MLVTGWIPKGKHEARADAGRKFKGHGEEKPDCCEVMWNGGTLKKFPTIAVLAGVAVGLLGIGDDRVIGPLFATLGTQPRVG